MTIAPHWSPSVRAVLLDEGSSTIIDMLSRSGLTWRTEMSEPAATSPDSSAPAGSGRLYFRYHYPHLHLHSVFGDGWFALKAEAFARFFGTPVFLVVQTIVVTVWIVLNVLGLTKFDVYPFILLNLAFSLQAAYAAPLILLAQTRQADRDKAHADADARHREDLAAAAEQRQMLAAQQTAQLLELLQQNTQLTELVKDLSQRIEGLTRDMHGAIVRESKNPRAPDGP
jgi:uncharacterized membrane protein